MSLKQVKYLLPAEKLDMGGFPVKQSLPTKQVQQVDPFLLLHHARTNVIQHKAAKHQGVGPHPHRGFSPVTFVVDGEIHHRDSRGHDQIARAGEVQWMHAGMGIVHSERPSHALVERNGHQEILQLWINSPSNKKMNIPTYQYLSKDSIPSFISNDNKISSKLIAGTYDDLNGKAVTESELLIIWAKAQKKGHETYIVPTGHNAMLYLINGNITLKKYGKVEKENLIIFDSEGTSISISALDDAEYVLLCGRPIGEQVVQHGPFVMNTQTEILEAIRDAQLGKMGILIEE